MDSEMPDAPLSVEVAAAEAQILKPVLKVIVVPTWNPLTKVL